jgi:hypothetical protein
MVILGRGTVSYERGTSVGRLFEWHNPPGALRGTHLENGPLRAVRLSP